MASTLQEKQEFIDREIVKGLIEATPQWWNSVVLEIEHLALIGGIEKYSHIITSPEKHRDVVEPTEQIYAATIELADLFKKYGRQWRKAVYTVSLMPDCSWKYTVDFEY